MSTDHGFKLLAIRPLEGCDPKFLKDLKEGMVYKFYQDYTYYVEDDEGNDVKLTHLNFDQFKSNPISKVDSLKQEVDLYSQDDLKINISAVVGKNGSGKSSLAEMFYKYIFDISISKVKKRNIERSNELCIDFDGELKRFSQQINELNKDPIDPKKKYSPTEIEDEMSRLRQSEEIEQEIKKIHRIQNDNTKLNTSNNVELFYELNGEIKKYRFEKEFPFYTISINHSAYSLNSQIVGGWIEKIFHKNDGYETPIVLNPMRTWGNIDINNELHLNKSRLLLDLEITKLFKKEVNTIEFSKHFHDDTKGKEFNNFYNVLHTDTVFIFKNDGFEGIKVRNSIIAGKSKTIPKKKIEESLILFSNEIHKVFQDISTLERFDLSKFQPNSLTEEQKILILKIYLFRYLQFKFIKYAKFKKIGIETNTGYLVKDFNRLLEKIRFDNSHQTFKIYQVLHLLKDSNFNLLLSKKDLFYLGLDKLKISINSTSLNDYFEEFEYLIGINLKQEIWKVPAAFFSSNLEFKNERDFEELSSGEIQMLNSINQVTYHLRNIESIEYCYDVINILFDEIELYFHIDYQRIFVSKLLEAIRTLRLKRIQKINILFLTHSPFILSDIPSQNVLRLENGLPSKNDPKETFGANLHDLLNDSFFLNEGFMGDFAKNKIIGLINYLNDKKVKTTDWNISKALDFIELIGEPFLKQDLKKLYQRKYEKLIEEKSLTDEEIDQEIERLKALKSKKR